MMQNQWRGTYLDGKTPVPHRVTVQLMQTGLEVVPESGPPFFWPYSEIRQTQGHYAGEPVRLERGWDLGEALQILDSAFLVELHRRVPELSLKFHNPTRRAMRLRLTVFAGIGAVGLSILIYVWGIPALASVITPFVPVSWEEQLGKSFMQHFAGEALRCDHPDLNGSVQEIVDSLLRNSPSQPYTFQVYLMDISQVNALAAPGGHIVIFRGLLKDTESPEELAGVLAHEIQHVLNRHGTKTILQEASTGILIAAVTGDATGAMAYGLEFARQFGMLRYSRKNEEEADEKGMRMVLAAGIDPSGMIGFFEKLEKTEKLNLPEFVLTHPATENRIERLTRLSKTAGEKQEKLLTRESWGHIKELCRNKSF